MQEKLTEMITASLKYAFGQKKDLQVRRVDREQLEELASACITACVGMDDNDFLFEDVYSWYQDRDVESIFLEKLEPFIDDDEITVMPPIVLKDLVGHYTARGFHSRLERDDLSSGLSDHGY